MNTRPKRIVIGEANIGVWSKQIRVSWHQNHGKVTTG